MIFVDTSVWIEALREASSPEGAHLASLLDADEVTLAAPVRLEILAGASKADRRRLRRTLDALPVFFPTAATWGLLDRWVDTAGDAHQRFGIADMLVAVLAAERGAPVWSNDRDFQRMERLGLVTTHRPPSTP